MTKEDKILREKMADQLRTWWRGEPAGVVATEEFINDRIDDFYAAFDQLKENQANENS